jgi:hypothetical protein
MLTKAILFTIIAACGIHTGADPNDPEREPPPPDHQEVPQTFCCTSVEGFVGEGCVAISSEHINTCSKVLSCGDVWQKVDGKVTCG